jgi:transcriptional regulator with XRE-family HTH domain
MGRASVKENKNIYQTLREALGLSREKAGELSEWISPERIEKIENEKRPPRPDEVLRMSQIYNAPILCNHYCSKECPIGLHYVPEIEKKDLAQIVLEMIASLNSVSNKKERFIEISANGLIEDDEIEEFADIQKELERISITVETLQLWFEKMLSDGAIDMEKYKAHRE